MRSPVFMLAAGAVFLCVAALAGDAETSGPVYQNAGGRANIDVVAGVALQPGECGDARQARALPSPQASVNIAEDGACRRTTFDTSAVLAQFIGDARDGTACCLGDECVMVMSPPECETLGGQFFIGHACDEAGFECPTCPLDGTLYGQQLTAPYPMYDTYPSSVDTGIRVYDRFWGVEGDICGLKWYGWGLGHGMVCTENPMSFDIRFHADDGDVPGTEVCAYTATVTGTPLYIDPTEPTPWYEYTLDFPTCCTLQEGWVSIASVGGDPNCVFGWLSSHDGDGSACTYYEFNGQWDCRDAGDRAFCLLGTIYPGACCDELAGTCVDGVEAEDCLPPSRFAPGVSCAAMNPPCGSLVGACCIDEPPYCYVEAEVLCTGTYLGHGTTCDLNDCNGNGIPDSCDLGTGVSQDCNGNGVPDECDIAGGAADYDGNGVPDVCDPDCDGNGVVDACDISCATGDCASHPLGCGGSEDCQPDGVPDECQLGAGGDPVLWDNGAANGENATTSQYSGQWSTFLTADDFELSEAGTIDRLAWYAEFSPDFFWINDARVEIFADSGAGPDINSQVVSTSVLGEGGTLIRIPDGPGSTLPNRYRLEAYGLNIPLEAGTWWLSLSPVAQPFPPIGNSRWCVSRSGVDVVGGETHMFAPQLGFTSFTPWSTLLPSAPYDAAFVVITDVYGSDCNSNGTPDDCDIADCDGSSWCQDCQGNGIPDGCETDCNANGTPDQCDSMFCDGSAWCSDCNANGILDECDVASGYSLDCNGNGVPDSCEVDSGMTPDCNGNGVPDDCDIDAGTSDDYDMNGVPDECDPDCNGNGIIDACDADCGTGNCGGHPLGCGGSIDCQPDGIPDECQLGAELGYQTDDGTMETAAGLSPGGSLVWLNAFTINDRYSTITSISLAWGNIPDGQPCTVYLWSDPDGNGDPADAQVLASAQTTVANAGTDTLTIVDIPDTYVGPAGTSFFAGAIMDHQPGEHPAAIDYQGWGRGYLGGSTSYALDPNNLSGGDQALVHYVPSWLVRAAGLAENDCNDNSIPDECDIASGYSEDCDLNGVPDECAWLDCDDNGVLDTCDILTCDGSVWCSDCNANGIPDVCDVPPIGTGADCQSNGIPDECEDDCNGNGIPDDCDIRDCDGSVWCDDCNENGVPDECDAGVPGGAVYQYDNGTSEDSLGIGEYAELAWIQRFQVEPGSETVVSIAACFGNVIWTGVSGVSPGQSLRVFVWDDPDNDGTPSDAVLLASADGVVEAGSIDTDVLQDVPIGPVTVAGSFFIGVAVETDGYAATMDTDGDLAHESWLAAAYVDEGGFDPTNFWADRTDDFGYPSNFLLRAQSDAGPSANDCNGNGIPDDCEICGDLDADGDVDYDDYVIFLEAFGGVTDGVPAVDYCCDYDGSGAVGMVDFDAWLACYRAYVNDPLAGPPTIGKRRIRVPLGPLPKQGLGPVPSP